MEEITFSIFNHGPKASSQMTTLLKQFEQQENIRVRLEMIPWSMGWQRLVEVGLYHVGPDVSEVGSTWVMDLVRMNALRPFSKPEADEITHGKLYFEAAWSGGIGPDQTIWAMPMGGDARVAFFRQDLLAEAGLEAEKAFANQTRLENTLAVLEKSTGLPPLALPTGRSRNNIHILASWIWGLGGDFLASDGQSIAFDSPAAMEGFKAYFSLGRFLNKQRMEEYESDAAFLQGRIPVTISGYWILHETKAEIVAKHLGVTSMPGIPFVGGQHLVLWKHSRKAEAALRLIHFLNRDASRQALHPHFGLPTAKNEWEGAPFNQPEYTTFAQALHHGRSFSTSQLWGLVEKRLADLLSEVWAEVILHPDRVDTIVENQIGTLAKRLRQTLKP